MWRILPAIPLRVKITSEFIQIEGYSVWLMGDCSRFDEPRIERKSAHEGEFTGIPKLLERCLGERERARRALTRQVRNDLARVPEHRPAAGMSILDVEHRIVA